MADQYPKRAGTLNTNPIVVGSTPIMIQAFGLVSGDCIKFYVLDKQGGTGFTTDGTPCANVVEPKDSNVFNRAPYMIGGKTPFLNVCQNSFIIDVPATYEIEITSTNAAMIVVRSSEAPVENITDSMRGLDYTECDCSKKPSVWVDTGEIACVNHVIEKQQKDQYGAIQWVSTGVECGYSPNETFIFKDGCCNTQRVAYMFDPYQDRPSDANVEIKGCDGSILGYIYDSASDEHSVPVSLCDGVVLGFVANQSASKPDLIHC